MKTRLTLIAALLLEVTFGSNAHALTDAERQRATDLNKADLNAAVAAGNLDAASEALEALKKLKKGAQQAADTRKARNHNDETAPVERLFKTWEDYGFSLSQAPDADGPSKGAQFGFTKDRHAGTPTSYNAQFYLKWDMTKVFFKGLANNNPREGGGLWLNSLATSVQGKIDSNDNTTSDAWRFRLEADVYDEFNPNDDALVNGIQSTFSAKDESDRDLHINRVGVEWWLTPMAQRIYVGRYSGDKNSWVRVRWRPYVGLDAGGTTTDAAHADKRDSNLWMMAKGKIELSFNKLQNALKLKGIILSTEDRLVYLTEQGITHNYLKTDLNVDFTDSIGFVLDYTVGEDSPKFQREDILTGALTVKF
jgi:hypothetical protein